jgi:hypothetical protein
MGRKIESHDLTSGTTNRVIMYKKFGLPLRPTQVSILEVVGAPSLRVKQPEREAEAEIKDA